MAKLKQVPDDSAVNGWAWLFPYAYGGLAGMKFSGITYGGKTPTDNSGLTFQLLIKIDRSDPDDDAVINITDQGQFTFLSDPLIVGYTLNTLTTGFTRNTRFPGELWLVDDDPVYARQLVNEFIVDLSNPIKQTFT